MAHNASIVSEKLSQKSFSLWKDLFLVVMGSLVLALCGPISIKLPFTLVPIALAPHICLALGALLGRNRGSLAVLLFIFQGVIGLPVFALGNFGLLCLFGPTGGYIVGYVAAAYFTGYLCERIQEKSSYKTFLALATGNAIIYLFGIPQLSFFIGFPSAILLGFLPFLIGDALKLLLVYKGIKLYR
ncbi:MAG: biotin transporter BioY [Chlamydiota bacterium]